MTLDLIKALILFFNILLDKLSSIQLDKYIVRCVKNWLTGWAQSVIVNGVTSGSWWVPQSSVLRPVLFNINDLVAECKHISLQITLN